MRRETFFMVAGVVSAVFGLAFLFAPDLSLRTYGVPTDPHNLMQARYFGSALLALGVVWFLARDTQDASAIRALLAGSLVGNIAGAVISASAAGHLQNAMAWLSVAIYGAFALASAYYLFAGSRTTQPMSA